MTVCSHVRHFTLLASGDIERAGQLNGYYFAVCHVGSCGILLTAIAYWPTGLRPHNETKLLSDFVFLPDTLESCGPVATESCYRIGLVR